MRKPLLITVGIVLIVFALYYPFSPAAVQSRNMARARAHIPMVLRAMGTGPSFTNVQLNVSTAKLGCLVVIGTVPTKADIEHLKEIVASTSPPTEVVFHVMSEDEMYGPQTAPTDR